MSFVSYAFAILFAIVFLLRITIGRKKNENSFLFCLLVASIFFYGWHVPSYITLLVISSIVDYFSGKYIGRPNRPPLYRKLALVASIVVNLGLLGVFKYTNFFITEVNQLISLFGGEGDISTLAIVLPIGISFYTFQSMSYTIDIYRGVLSPIHCFWKFFLYVSFFPQLVAGPIVKAKDFIYQIDRKRRLHMNVFLEGAFLIIQGFFLKRVIADNLGVVVDANWANAASEGGNGFLAVITVFSFSFQIFADFAGYSLIAIGLAYILGFKLPVNFNSPYIAGTFKEFWTRWHISLSRWLREYLYFSLGGNKKGPKRTYLNVLLVMVLGGLWHGAAIQYVVWGAVHGVGLAVERILGFENLSTKKGNVLLRVFWFFVVQITVLVAYVYFRSQNLGEAGQILKNAFTGGFAPLKEFPLGLVCLLFIPIVVMHVRTFLCERRIVGSPGRLERAILAALMLYTTITCYGASNAFVYFQF